MKQESQAERLRHNYQRMKILKVLNKMPGVGVGVEMEFAELMEGCRRFGSPMPPKLLAYHLRYMQLKGWVKLRIEDTDDDVDVVVGVTLTDKGVDRIDIGKMPELEG